MAVDGPPVAADKDTVYWNWGLVGSALDYLQVALPRARQWPVAVGGFSGGAKRAACVAAALVQARRPVLGVFMGVRRGSSHDRATLFRPGPSFLTTPLWLSNGSNDPIAGPAHGAAVKAQMVASGFRRVRLETYAGGHQLHGPHVREALRWFAAAPGPK
jgi:predicted esterase